LAEARLVIEEAPLLAHCPTCGTTKPVVSVQELCCTNCGTAAPELLSGRELEVVALEIQ
jgi:hydrogenase nickel incorporation protein HypA/HybF